jgi:ferrous iron transport protein B
VAEPASALIDWLKGHCAGLVETALAEGALRSLIVGGMIEGVGGVLVFLPQIFVLFLFIAILEDCGYMARAAYLMDRLMSRVGLSGKSFIPLLSSFACAVPGIMSARSIEHPRDRLTTILIAPLMSCSARLPVYALLIGAFIPDVRFDPLGLVGLKGLTLLAMYLVGIVAAVFVSLVLRHTILRGPTPPFVMELPSYKFPGLGIVLYRMFDRGWAFVRRAGTIIFAVAVVVWAAAYFPHDESLLDPALVSRRDQLQQQIQALSDEAADSSSAASQDERSDSDSDATSNPEGAVRRAEIERLTEDLAAVNNDIKAEFLATSFLGRTGKWIEPVVRPLGWDWRIGCAAIASFPAREVVVATLGVIYHMGEGQDEKSPGLRSALQSATWEGTDRPVFNVPVALSLMVFFALCAQCASTLAVMKRETNSWRWPIFSFVYMTTLAYLAAMATYQIGMLFVT